MKTYGKALAAMVLGLGLIWATGCGKPSTTPKPAPKPDDDHDHGPGPHQGVIIEFQKWHGEFKPDHAKKEATVWILGMDAKTPARIKTDKLRLVVSNTTPKIEIDLLPTDADKDGTASTFVGKHDGFAKEMDFKGTVTFTVDGKPYPGEFDETPKKK